jgi:peptidyl-prolyl cis-trans isomerase B (cyclophilin B)
MVFAFVFSPLGIVFGIVGRRQTRRTGQRGRGLATVGLALSVVFLVVGVAVAVYVTVFAVQIATSVPIGVGDQPGISAPAGPSGPVPTAPVPSAPAPSGPVPSGPAGTATVGVTDGDYGPEVPSAALAEQVGVGSGATDVICPGYLPAQIDASTTCAGTVDGQQAQLQTRVTAVAGAEATVDITRVG